MLIKELINSKKQGIKESAQQMSTDDAVKIVVSHGILRKQGTTYVLTPTWADRDDQRDITYFKKISGKDLQQLIDAVSSLSKEGYYGSTFHRIINLMKEELTRRKSFEGYTKKSKQDVKEDMHEPMPPKEFELFVEPYSRDFWGGERGSWPSASFQVSEVAHELRKDPKEVAQIIIKFARENPDHSEFSDSAVKNAVKDLMRWGVAEDVHEDDLHEVLEEIYEHLMEARSAARLLDRRFDNHWSEDKASSLQAHIAQAITMCKHLNEHISSKGEE